MHQVSRLLVSFVLIFCTCGLLWSADGDDSAAKPRSPNKSDDTLAVARERQMAHAQYQLARAKAQVEEMRARLELARQQVEVARQRYKVGEEVQAAVQKAETQVIAAQAAVDSATANLQLQEKELELIQKELAVARDDQVKRQAEIAALEAELAAAAARVKQLEDQKAGLAEAWKAQLSRSNSKETARRVEAERQKLEALLQEAQAQTILRKAQLQARKDGTGKHVTIEAPRLTDGSEVIHMLFSAAGASYVVDHNVRAPAISMSLNDIPFEKALNIVMEALGIRYEVKDGIYYLKPATQAAARDYRALMGYLGDTAMTTGPAATYGELARKGYLSTSTLPKASVAVSPSTNLRTRTYAAAAGYLSLAPSGRASRPVPAPSPPALAQPSVPSVPAISAYPAPAPYVAAGPAGTRSTFKCPSCKKTETIVHSSATARGRWKYCPHCGKRVK